MLVDLFVVLYVYKVKLNTQVVLMRKIGMFKIYIIQYVKYSSQNEKQRIFLNVRLFLKVQDIFNYILLVDFILQIE